MQDSNNGIIKLFYKLLLLIILSVLVIVSYNTLYLKIALYERNPEFSITKFKSVPRDIEVCNFGNSLGVDAFGDYSGIDCNCFNFALSAQSLSYDYRILQQYKDYIGKDGIVFISLSYFCFQVDEENEEGFLAKNERYYYFLKPEYVKGCSWIEYAFIHTLPVLWQSPISLIQKTEAYMDEKSKGANENHIDYQKSAKELYNGRIVTDLDGNLIINDEELNSLYGMIDICKEINAKPILIITPYRKEYTDLFDDNFKDQYYSLLHDICAEKDCELFDFSQDVRFNKNDDCFDYAYHLNYYGSSQFMDIISSEILDKYK